MRSRWTFALTLWCSAGCRQLFGFEEPIVLDATETYEVTGTYRERYGGNNADLVPTFFERIPQINEVTMSVELADGGSSPVEYRNDGTFSFLRSRPDEPYELTVGNLRYQHTAAHLTLGFLVPGRLDVAPLTQDAIVQIRLGPQAGGYPYVVTTGIWGQYVPQTGAGVGDFDISWRNMTGYAPYGLLEAAKHDRMYVSYFENQEAMTEPYIAMVRAVPLAVTVPDGGTTTAVQQPTMPFSRNYCVREQARRAAAVDRVRTALPMYTSLTGEYRIAAAPKADYPFLPNLILAYDTNSTDPNVRIDYGNPYPGTQVVSGISVVARRDAALPDNAPLPLTSVGLQTYQLEMTATCPTVMPALDVGIAGVPSLAGVPLTTDGAQLVIPGTDRLEVTWQLGSPGPVDYTNVTLFEVNLRGAIPATREIHRFVTTGTSVKVPRSLFEPSQYYVIGIQTVRGIPQAAAGDFETFSYPTGWMLVLSSPFRVGG